MMWISIIFITMVALAVIMFKFKKKDSTTPLNNKGGGSLLRDTLPKNRDNI